MCYVWKEIHCGQSEHGSLEFCRWKIAWWWGIGALGERGVGDRRGGGCSSCFPGLKVGMVVLGFSRWKKL